MQFINMAYNSTKFSTIKPTYSRSNTIQLQARIHTHTFINTNSPTSIGSFRQNKSYTLCNDTADETDERKAEKTIYKNFDWLPLDSFGCI